MHNIILALVSVMLLIIAYLIGIKHKVSLLHDYHYANVTSDKIIPYSRIMGFGIFLMAMSFIKYSIFAYWFPPLSTWILWGGISISVCVLVYAQYRYNKGIFS